MRPWRRECDIWQEITFGFICQFHVFLKESFKEWQANNAEATVILEEKRDYMDRIGDGVSGETPRPGIKQEIKVRA